MIQERSSDFNDDLQPLPFIILPNNKLKVVWNGVIMLMLIYTIVFVPLEIAFLSEIQNPIAEPLFKGLDIICDIIFALDMFITFITAIEVPGRKPEV